MGEFSKYLPSNGSEQKQEAMDMSKYLPGAVRGPVGSRMQQAVANTSDPVKEAEIESIASQIGLPKEIVRQNFDASKNRAELQATNKMAKGNPVEGFVENASNYAGVRDDIAAMVEVGKWPDINKQREVMGVDATALGEDRATGQFALDTMADFAKDVGISTVKGVISAPEAVVGIADIFTLGRVGKELEDFLGYKPEEAKQILDSWHSEGHKAKQEEFAQAEGVLGKAEAAITNPSLIGHTVLESLPLMFGGAVLARGMLGLGAKALPAGVSGPLLPGFMTRKFAENAPHIAAAIGEGVMSAGIMAESIRSENVDRHLSFKQAGLSSVAGVAVSFFGWLGARAAKWAGVTDIDVLLTGQGMAKGANKALGRKVIEGAITEGFLEELPQSLSEQLLQNVAQDKPIFDGLDEAAVMGTFAGVVMGGGANIYTSSISTISDVRRNARLADLAENFAEQQKDLAKRVDGTETAKRNPSLMESFLNNNMGMRNQEAYIDGDAILELSQSNPEIIQEIADLRGVTVTEVTAAAREGRSIRMPLGEFHSQLTPESRAKLFDHLKAAPGAYSVSQVSEGLAQAEEAFEEQFESFTTANEEVVTEMTRLEEQAVAAGEDPVVARQWGQVAARMAFSLAEKGTDERTASDILKTIQFRRGEAEQTFTLEEQLAIKERKLARLEYSEELDRRKGVTSFKGKEKRKVVAKPPPIEEKPVTQEEKLAILERKLERLEYNEELDRRKGITLFTGKDKRAKSTATTAAKETLFQPGQQPAFVFQRGQGLNAYAPEKLASGSRIEIQQKLQDIFGNYEELERIENEGAQNDEETKQLETANAFMADLEYAAVLEDVSEVATLLTAAQEYAQKPVGVEAQEDETKIAEEKKLREVELREREKVQRLPGEKPTDPLIKEAKKYKTVKEFIESQPTERKNIDINELENVGTRLPVTHKQVESIRDLSKIDPIVLEIKKDGSYRMIDGSHRLSAMRFAGIKKVPVLLQKPEAELTEIWEEAQKLGGQLQQSQLRTKESKRNYSVPLNLAQERGKRGVLQIFDDKYIINLLENADASTPFHELSHVYLNEMLNMVSSGVASKAMQKDLQSTLAWLGAASVEELTEEQLEQFADGFEVYLMEGKAPTPELIPAFKRFARWIKEVYKRIKGPDVKLSPEIREVYDRMLTTEQQIEATVGAVGLAPMTKAEMDDLGVVTEDRAYLTGLHVDATEEAERKMFAAIHQGIKDKLPDWREEGEKIADKNRMHQIVTDLKKGKISDEKLSLEQKEDIQFEQNRIIEAQVQKDTAREIRQKYYKKIRVVKGSFMYTEIQDAELSSYFKTTDKDASEIDVHAENAGMGDDVDGFLDMLIQAQEDYASAVDTLREAKDALDSLTKAGINRQTAIETWGQEVIDQMPPGLKTIFKVDGMHPDEAAEESGFNSAEELFDALQAYIPRTQEIKNYVDQQKAAYEASFDPTDFIFDTKEFAEYLGVIGKYVNGMMDAEAQVNEFTVGRKGRKPALARSAFKSYAEAILRDMPLRDAIRSDIFIAAVNKAATAEIAAVKKKDWAAAQAANEQRRLNFEMAKKSRGIRTDVEAMQRRAKRLKKAKPDKVDPAYLGATLKLLERFNLVELGPGYAPVLEKAGDIKTLLAADSTDELGPADFNFDPFLTDIDTPLDYKDLTADGLAELKALLKTLERKGRDAISPRLTSIDKTLEEVEVELIAILSTLKDKPKWAKRGKAFFGIDPTAALRKMQDAAREHYADTNQLWAMIRVLDGFVYYTNDGEAGPFERYFRDNLEKAYATKSDMQVIYKPMLEAAMLKLFERGRNMSFNLNEYIDVPRTPAMIADNRQWDFEAVTAVALNVGNESNLLRLQEGYGWSDEQLTSILSMLNDKEWDAIQDMWDIFEAMRPAMFAAAERIHGVAPPHIKPQSFTTPTGKRMRGGYAPAVYDQRNIRAAEMTEKQILSESSNAAHQRPAVNARATKTRAATGGGMQIRLDLSGISRQYGYNLQYAAFAETVRDLSRILNKQEIADAIAQKVGPEWLPAMREILANVANPGVDSRSHWANRLIQRMGYSASKYILGLNRSVGIKQTFSVPGIYLEGGSWHKGLTTIMKNPIKAWELMMEESPAMRQRFGDRQIDREIQKQRKKLLARSKMEGVPREIIDATLFMYIRAFDALVVFPAYYGTKQKMEAKYGPGQRAIRETEKIILDTQPISREIDLSTMQLERKALSRMFTFFSGFAMKFENRKRVYVRGFLEGKIPLRKFVTHVMMERILPPMIMSFMFTAGAGDDTDWEDVGWDVLLYQVFGFPIVRELSVLTANTIRYATDEDFRGFSAFGTPMSTIPDAVEWNMNTIAKWFSDEGETVDGVLAAMDLILALNGVPAIKAYKDIEEGIRQAEQSDGGFDKLFKLLIKPDPQERER